jgi:hypothetical protein
MRRISLRSGACALGWLVAVGVSVAPMACSNATSTHVPEVAKDPHAGARGPGDPHHTIGGDEGEGDGTESGPPTEPIEVMPSIEHIRLLNGREITDTVRDLLGLELTTPLAHADWSTGFDTGGNTRLDENLLSQLAVQAEDLAQRWVRERAAADFPCFSPAAITQACVEQIVDTLGARAQRRPLDPALRADLLAAFQAAVAEDDAVPFASCDEAVQPAGHFGMREGQCRPSCGILGGSCTSVAAGCSDGAGPAGLSYDCELCCVAGGSFADEPRLAALTYVVERLLLSPRFLYRTEVGAGGELDAFDRASLVSYAIVGSMPDAPLFADALAGTLDDVKLAAHVRRLLSSERGQVRLAKMIEQWVRASDLEDMAARPQDFSKIASPEQGRAMRDEVLAFTRSVVFQGSGTLTDLLTSPTAFVNRHNADLYGVTSDTDTLTPRAMDPAQRSGLLTLPGVMAAHAWKDLDSVDNDRPVKRGLLVFNKLLCHELHLPANFMPGLLDKNAIEDFDFLTTRDQFTAAMNQNASCKSCHVQFMPYGFAFASYDGLGRYRTHQRGWPLNVTVDVMLDDEPLHFADAPELLRWIAAQPAAAECFARNYTAYVLGSTSGTALPPYDPASGNPPPEPDTRPVRTLAAAVTQQLGGERDNLPSLVEAILSRPETFRRSAP